MTFTTYVLYCKYTRQLNSLSLVTNQLFPGCTSEESQRSSPEWTSFASTSSSFIPTNAKHCQPEDPEQDQDSDRYGFGGTNFYRILCIFPLNLTPAYFYFRRRGKPICLQDHSKTYPRECKNYWRSSEKT